MNWVYLILGILAIGFGLMLLIGALRQRGAYDDDLEVEYKDGVPVLPRHARGVATADQVQDQPIAKHQVDAHVADALSGLAAAASQAQTQPHQQIQSSYLQPSHEIPPQQQSEPYTQQVHGVQAFSHPNQINQVNHTSQVSPITSHQVTNQDVGRQAFDGQGINTIDNAISGNKTTSNGVANAQTGVQSNAPMHTPVIEPKLESVAYSLAQPIAEQMATQEALHPAHQTHTPAHTTHAFENTQDDYPSAQSMSEFLQVGDSVVPSNALFDHESVSERQFDNRAEVQFADHSPVIDQHFYQQGSYEQGDEAAVSNKDALTVLISPKNVFQEVTGVQVLNFTKTYGMRFGFKKMFHRHECDDGTGELWFSMLATTHDGVTPFDLNGLPEARFRGLALFILTPHANALKAFDSMMSVAQMIADELDADIPDEEGYLITCEDVAKIRHTLASGS